MNLWNKMYIVGNNYTLYIINKLTRRTRCKQNKRTIHDNKIFLFMLNVLLYLI